MSKLITAISNAANAPTPIGAYSQVTIANGLAFCAGQIAIDPATGKLIDGDVVAQTKQVLSNLDYVLKAANSSWHHVTMTSVFLPDLTNSKIVNELYSGYVNLEAPPARQTLGVKELPLGALVEISVIAVTK